MKNKFLLSLFPGILFAFYCLPFFGQQTTIEIFKDTLFIPKQAIFNKVDSRKTLHFKLPQNTIKWLYYFESIDKMQIRDALARNYYSPSDFEASSVKKMEKEVAYTTARKMGPVKLEILLLEDKGEEEFLRIKNDLYVFTRPDDFIRQGSSLCEVGDCYSSGKIIIDTNSPGKPVLGFRNIDYRKDAYILVQIVALVK